MKRSSPLQLTYFRLCHRCSHLNESDVEVVRCERCQKTLGQIRAPQNLEPDPKKGVWSDVDDDSDDDELEGETARRPPPLAGLSAIF